MDERWLDGRWMKVVHERLWQKEKEMRWGGVSGHGQHAGKENRVRRERDKHLIMTEID